jgi:hypothetical protein
VAGAAGDPEPVVDRVAVAVVHRPVAQELVGGAEDDEAVAGVAGRHAVGERDAGARTGSEAPPAEDTLGDVSITMDLTPR